MVTGSRQNQRSCGNCGADVRENTAFCYKCGVPVAGDDQPEPLTEQSKENEAVSADTAADERTRSALDDLANRLQEQKRDEKHLAKAAIERRKARTAQRKPKPAVWEPDEDSPALLLIAITVIVLIAALLIVYFTTIAK